MFHSTVHFNVMHQFADDPSNSVKLPVNLNLRPRRSLSLSHRAGPGSAPVSVNSHGALTAVSVTP